MAPGRLWIAASVGVALFVPDRGASAEPAGGTAPGAAAAEAAPSAGVASLGKDLFTGATPMRSGGAACGACHALGGHGPALAASLGPDLSHSFEGMPAEAIDGMLQDLPFPTMSPIYAGRALTPQERAHLAAFLVTGAGAVPPGATGIATYAAAIAAVLLALLAIGARRRKRPTRAGLVARPPAPGRAPLVPRRAVETPEASVAARGAAGGSR